MGFIDTHCHVGRLEHWGPTIVERFAQTGTQSADAFDIVPDRLLAQMDEAGIEQSVILAFDTERTLGAWIPNDYVADIAMGHPDRFIGFASVDPLRPGAVEELERAVKELGLRGLKTAPTYQHYSPTDPRAVLLFAKARDLGIPVLIHQGWTSLAECPVSLQDVNQLDEVARALPDLTIIIAHCGGPKFMECLCLMATHPNLYADLSALLSPFWGGRKTVVRVLGMARHLLGGFDRILWATDYPIITPGEGVEKMQTINEIANSMGEDPFSPSELDSLMFGNAHRLLHGAKSERRSTARTSEPV